MSRPPEQPRAPGDERSSDDPAPPPPGSVEETRQADPDAPGLGGLDGAEERDDLPESKEPG
jgi:hypothetical protein